MTLALRRTALALGLIACTHTAPHATSTHEAARTTRYRVGDFVVYRHEGLFTPMPVTLREEVTGREGSRLRIEVSATRGGESMRWVQVVTDTPENERDNVIDALYEWREGRLVRLDNRGNADAFRLYAWTFIEPEGRATDRHQRACEQTLGGVRMACTCTTGRNRWQGRPVAFTESECPGFLWTHGPGVFVDETSGQDVQRTEVLDSGHVEGAHPRSLDPLAD